MKLLINRSLALLVTCVLAAPTASARDRPMEPEVLATAGPAADYPVVVGAPFTIDGTTYTPADTMNYDAVGYASISGSNAGSAISGSHRTLPLPSYVEVTSLDSGRTILVRLERRGPMMGDRLVELTPAAADQLGIAGNLRAPVRVRRVNPPETERAMLRTNQPAPLRMETPKSLLGVLMRKLNPAAPVVLTAAPLPPSLPKPLAAAPLVKPTPRASVAAPIVPAVPKIRPVRAVTPPQNPLAAAAPAKPTPHIKMPGTVATVLPKVGPPRGLSLAPIVSVKPAPASSLVTKPNASKPEGSKGKMLVQVASFISTASAKRAAAALGGRTVISGKLTRVVMGPYATAAQATAALAKARAASYSDARIQHSD